MTSHFHGSNNLVMIISLVFILLIFVGIPMAARRENPMVKLFSSEDSIKIAGYGEDKLSTVLVSGRVFCYACLDKKTRWHPLPVSGALVAISCCTSEKKKRLHWVQGTTDEYGDFLIDLPSHLHAIPNLEKKCVVKVVQLPKNTRCSPYFTGKHKGIKLSSSKYGIRS